MAGGSSGGSSGGKKKARIEIIPLIDVIFFLLATFVLFTLSLNRSQGVHVALPETETGIPRDPSGTATISVTQEGTMAWDKDPVTLEEFLIRLRPVPQRASGRGRARSSSTRDSEASYSSVIYALDEVRKMGISKVSIESRAKPPEK